MCVCVRDHMSTRHNPLYRYTIITKYDVKLDRRTDNYIGRDTRCLGFSVVLKSNEIKNCTADEFPQGLDCRPAVPNMTGKPDCVRQTSLNSAYPVWSNTCNVISCNASGTYLATCTALHGTYFPFLSYEQL